MQRLSTYKDYTISTSVVASDGKPFEASFIVSRRIEGDEYEILLTERLGKTFAYGGDARAAAYDAARAYVDSLI